MHFERVYQENSFLYLNLEKVIFNQLLAADRATLLALSSSDEIKEVVWNFYAMVLIGITYPFAKSVGIL